MICFNNTIRTQAEFGNSLREKLTIFHLIEMALKNLKKLYNK